MTCWWSFITIGQTVDSPAWFENSEIRKVSGVPLNSDTQFVLVLIYLTVESWIFDFVIPISLALSVSAEFLIILVIVIEIWKQSDFEPSPPRILHDTRMDL